MAFAGALNEWSNTLTMVVIQGGSCCRAWPTSMTPISWPTGPNNNSGIKPPGLGENYISIREIPQTSVCLCAHTYCVAARAKTLINNC